MCSRESYTGFPQIITLAASRLSFRLTSQAAVAAVVAVTLSCGEKSGDQSQDWGSSTVVIGPKTREGAEPLAERLSSTGTDPEVQSIGTRRATRGAPGPCDPNSTSTAGLCAGSRADQESQQSPAKARASANDEPAPAASRETGHSATKVGADASTSGGEPGKPALTATERALFTAASRGNAQDTAALLRGGVDVNAVDEKGWSPLTWAIDKGHAKVAVLLIEGGASVNHQTRFGSSVLAFAVGRGLSAVVKKLLEHGADPNLADSDGAVALMQAAQTGNIHFAEQLLRHGARLHHRTNVGETALMMAAANNRLNAARWLIERGAEIDAKNELGTTALMFAAERSRPELLTLLIQRGANVNARGSQGRTPLIYAAAKGRGENVRILLQAGADVAARARFKNATDTYDAIDATRPGDSKIREMLQRAKGKLLQSRKAGHAQN